jgi:hypothetical protein
MPFRGARHGGRMGTGGTVPWNASDLSTQRACSARTVRGMVAQRRPGRTVPGLDSRPTSGDRRGEDSPFDHGACGVTGQLMPLSGGADEGSRVEGESRTRRRSARGASSEAETRSRDV